MARRKKTARRRPRGRVGRVIPRKYETDAYLAVGVVGGMLIARMVPGMVNRIAPGMSPLVTNVVQAGIGVAVAVSSAKIPLLRGAALGVAGMGLMDAATNAGWLPDSQGETAPAVSGREVLIDLDGSGARNRLAGGIGKGYTGNYAANRLAGELGAAGILV